MELFEAIVDKNTYTVTFENFVFEEELNVYGKPVVKISADNVLVKINNEVASETIGETFSGNYYGHEDLFKRLVREYVNNNTAIVFSTVPKMIMDVKQSFFVPALKVLSHEIPERIIGATGKVLTLKAATNGYSQKYKNENPNYARSYHGVSVYDDEFEECCALDQNGETLTDMDFFCATLIYDMRYNENIVYGSDYIKQTAEYYGFDDEDDDE